MINSCLIRLKNISKKYILHHQKPTLVESFFAQNEEFWALKNISLEIGQGEKVGIIGPNGSGKSTLLKIISGITAATKGRVQTNGRIASLIELTAGFHPDLTGEENIFINGLLLGMSSREIKTQYKKIVEFAELGQFIDSPFYTYSGGMKLRLGFSVAIHSQPEILIIDEILGIGDKFFQEKCYKKIKDFQGGKRIFIFVSHNLQAIAQICNRSLFLSGGEIKKDDKTGKVIDFYQTLTKPQ